MTINNIVYWKTTVTGTYLMNAGDVISRHKHAWQHTICLVVGAGEFEIYEGPDTGVTAMEVNKNYLLPSDIEHEIRALTDTTVMIAMTDKVDAESKPVQARNGGIMLADGTVVY